MNKTVKKKANLNIRLTPEFYDEIRKTAQIKEMDVSSFVRWAIKEHIERLK